MKQTNKLCLLSREAISVVCSKFPRARDDDIGDAQNHNKIGGYRGRLCRIDTNAYTSPTPYSDDMDYGIVLAFHAFFRVRVP
jgi:hypothetical protein